MTEAAVVAALKEWPDFQPSDDAAAVNYYACLPIDIIPAGSVSHAESVSHKPWTLYKISPIPSDQRGANALVFRAHFSDTDGTNTSEDGTTLSCHYQDQCTQSRSLWRCTASPQPPRKNLTYAPSTNTLTMESTVCCNFTLRPQQSPKRTFTIIRREEEPETYECVDEVNAEALRVIAQSIENYRDFLAHNGSSKCAIKIDIGDEKQQAKFDQQFKAEIEMLKNFIADTGILTLMGHSKDYKILVTEQCQQDVISYLNPIVSERVIDDAQYNTVKNTFIQILQAVKQMHDKRYSHGDLKPENIMLRENGSVCIIDLATAKSIDEAQYTFAGTEAYLSPEMWEAHIARQDAAADAAADVNTWTPDKWKKSDVWMLGMTFGNLLHVSQIKSAIKAQRCRPNPLHGKDLTTDKRIFENIVEIIQHSMLTENFRDRKTIEECISAFEGL